MRTRRSTKASRRPCRHSAIVWKRLGELAALDAAFAPHLEARDVGQVAARGPRVLPASYAAGIDASPERLQEVEDRLALLERLKKKHGPSLDDVIAKAASLRQDLHDLAHGAERAAELDAALAAARRVYPGTRRGALEAADGRGRRRSRARSRGRWPIWRWRARDARSASSGASSEAQWSAAGIDQAEFFISPNPGEDLRPLARIVSGGELSRIMLALKTLASTDAPGKTLIFDEVDAGIGGAVADVVGGTAAAARRDGSRCSASPTCRRSPRTARRTSRSPSRCGRDGR